MFAKRIAVVLIIYLMGISMAIARIGNESETIKFDRFKGHLAPIISLASTTPSDSVNYIVSGAKDGTMGVWQVAPTKLLQMWRGHAAGVSSVKLFQSGQDYSIVSGSLDGTIKLWDLKTGTLIQTLQTTNAPVIKIEDIDDTRFASLSQDGKINIWSLISRKPLWTKHHEGATQASAYLQNFITGSKEDIRYWRLNDGTYSEYKIPALDSMHGLLIGTPAPYFVITLANTYKVWYWYNNTEKSCPMADGSNNMIRMGDYVNYNYKILNATQKSSFEIYDYYNNKVVWSAKISDQSLGAICVAALKWHIVFGSLETGDLMISQEPVLPLNP